MNLKRNLEIAVVSDVHLGSYGCHANELLTYLNSINPKKLILNGDIIDTWQFNEHYFPATHLNVVRKIIDMASNGTEIIYITGNHDEIFRKFSNTDLGNIKIVNQLVLELHGKKAWFFHGDVFDASIQNAKWLAKLGGYSYSALISINYLINRYLEWIGKEKYSLVKKIKNNVKQAVKFISDFEKITADYAIAKGYDYVICGHIHHPKKALVENKKGKTLYLNSGDWVESFTSLEYQFKRWKIYHYSKDKLLPFHNNEYYNDNEFNSLIAAITIVDLKQKKS